MKQLIDYIKHSVCKYKHMDDMEKDINMFIMNNYGKIKPDKYFSIICDERYDCFYNAVINPNFEEQLKIHYPERLI